MPLYEYKCSACGHQYEVIRKFSDPPEDKCPKCGGPVHKVQSAPAFQFKGTGWYVTDYAKSGQSEDRPESKDSRKADTKTEAEKTGSADASTKSESPSASPSAAAASSGSASKSGD